ncbi:hypothetical protein LPA44_14055 [Halobacterium sp. KA-4]|uniref:hypothetical protein n=1 Tax=Halobacterium sp. KA-4 TaxID=2896367 RepID=UPI001E2E29B5|nr:hypothetical protein [Halobacterium sp. KA-4]MCD2201008.1 hypothetical protein [Halobacterium sp. KA-4]
MSVDMNSTEDDDEAQSKIRTSIEVDEAVWRELRANAVREDRKISEQLEVVLEDYYGLANNDNSTNDN